MLNNEQTKKMYNELRSIPWAKWSAADPKSFLEMVPENERSSIKDPAACGSGLLLLARMAHQTTEEEFNQSVANSETPPMKFTAQEMELLKGGGPWFWVQFVCGYAVSKLWHWD